MSQAIGRLFNVPSGDQNGEIQATAVALMHQGMVRKMAQKIFKVKPNPTAIKHLALSKDEIVDFLAQVKSADSSGTLLESFEKMIASNYSDLVDKSTGLFLYLYFMHEKDPDDKILSRLSAGSDLRALKADLKSFFDAHISLDSGSEIVEKACAVVQTLAANSLDEPQLLSDTDSDDEKPEMPRLPVPVLPTPDIPTMEEMTTPAVQSSSETVQPKRLKIQKRDCTAAYYTDDIVQEFRSVVGLEQTVDRKRVAQLLLAMYLPQQVLDTTAFVNLAHKLRLRPHHVEWSRIYASHHPELSSHCWCTLVDSIGADNQSEFVVKMTSDLRLPCYASSKDNLIASLAITQFNYMSIIGTRLRTTTIHQDRHLRCMRINYMHDVPVDDLNTFFETLVLPVRS